MPIQPELGMGALAEGAALVLDDSTVRWSGATSHELLALVHQKAAEIRRHAQLYRGNTAPPDVHGKSVSLVDDGFATGGTLRAAVRGARKRGAAWGVVAAPVASAEAAAALRREADELVCLSLPHHLMSVGAWYQDFRQLTEDEVVDLLHEAQRRASSAASARDDPRSKYAERGTNRASARRALLPARARARPAARHSRRPSPYRRSPRGRSCPRPRASAPASLPPASSPASASSPRPSPAPSSSARLSLRLLLPGLSLARPPSPRASSPASSRQPSPCPSLQSSSSPWPWGRR